MNAEVYGVLTGDLVQSSRLSSEASAQAMQWLREASARFGGQHPGSVIGELDTFRHDSWQLLLARPELSLRAAVYLRTALKLHSGNGAGYDTRISMGIGGVELIAKGRISDSRGGAFTLSGKNLDAMDRVRMIWEAESMDGAGRVIKGAVVPLLDCVVTDWTPTEAGVVHGSLEGRTQEQIAQVSPRNPRTGKVVTRQAIADSMDRGHWGIVEEALRFMEEDKLWNLR